MKDLFKINFQMIASLIWVFCGLVQYFICHNVNAVVLCVFLFIFNILHGADTNMINCLIKDVTKLMEMNKELNEKLKEYENHSK